MNKALFRYAGPSDYQPTIAVVAEWWAGHRRTSPSADAGLTALRMALLVGGFLALIGLASVTDAAQLRLSWTDNSDNEDGFRIERRTEPGGTYGGIAVRSSNTTRYVDTTVAAGGTYCYRVRAFNDAGESGPSNEACATAKALVPAVLYALGDWNGTGTTKVGIYRNGTWYLDRNGNGVFDGATETVAWGGMPEDVPVVGDWNNSGTTKIGIYRNGTWYLDKNGNGVFDGAAETLTWGGRPEDIPVVGDWNNTGATKIGIYRNGTWYLDKNGSGVWDAATEGAIAWGGTPEDTPVLGDWNGTGSTKIGIYRDGMWYLDTNGNGVWDAATDGAIPWGGVPEDTPVVGRW